MILLAAWLAVALPSVDTMSLASAVILARRNRGVLRVAGARVAVAQAGVRLAGQLPNPTASASHTEAAPEYHLSAQMPFDWLLTRRPEVAAAKALVERARVDSALADVLLVAEVRRAFFGLLIAERAEAVAVAEGGIADSVVRIAAARLARGDIAQMELTQLELEAGRVRQLLSRAREGRRLAATGLARTVGTVSDPNLQLIGEADLELGVGAAPEVSLERMPGVRQAAADSLTAAHELIGSRRARVPLPGIEIGHEWRDPTLPGRSFWLFGLTMPIPLLNQGAGRVAASSARADQATAAMAEARLDAAQQLEEARVGLEEAATRALRARDSLIPAAQRLRAQAVRAYQLGETTLLTVLEALRAEREAESAGLEDLLRFQEAKATWDALLGFGH